MKTTYLEETSKRAAMWAATLRDDVASLREHAREVKDPKARMEIVSLANALNRAAKVLDAPAGQVRAKRHKPARKKTKRKSAEGRRERKRRAVDAISERRRAG